MLCPACDHTLEQSQTLKTIKDHSITGKNYSILNCNNCGLLKTEFDDFENLSEYYESTDYASHKLNFLNPIHLIYSIARIFTSKSKESVLRLYLTGNSVLDYGCGSGFFLKQLAKKGWAAEGYEPNEKARQEAEKTTGKLIHKDTSTITSTFSGITLWHVLEHTKDPSITIEELKTRIRQDGKIILAVPNYKSLDGEYYGAHWAGYDVPRHLWHFTQKSIKELAAKHDMRVASTIPMKLDSYYVSLLSEKYVHGKTTLSTIINAIRTGLKSNAAARRTAEYSSLIYILSK